MSWFSTLESQFSFWFHWSPLSSNFWLCLLETQVTTYLEKMRKVAHIAKVSISLRPYGEVSLATSLWEALISLKKGGGGGQKHTYTHMHGHTRTQTLQILDWMLHNNCLLHFSCMLMYYYGINQRGWGRSLCGGPLLSRVTNVNGSPNTSFISASTKIDAWQVGIYSKKVGVALRIICFFSTFLKPFFVDGWCAS